MLGHFLRHSKKNPLFSKVIIKVNYLKPCFKTTSVLQKKLFDPNPCLSPICGCIKGFHLLFCVDFKPESIPEDLTAAGENNGEYLEVARKGGRKGKEKQTQHHCKWHVPTAQLIPVKTLWTTVKSFKWQEF